MEFLGPSDPNDTEKAVFLHPVIRHYYKGEMEEFHFGDSLLGRWDMPHASGGAVGSYHQAFYKWLSAFMKFQGENGLYEAEQDNPNFVKWQTV